MRGLRTDDISASVFVGLLLVPEQAVLANRRPVTARDVTPDMSFMLRAPALEYFSTMRPVGRALSA
jgi:hypothetical protein